MNASSGAAYTVYPLGILQEVLKRLWELADENGYVLKSPGIILRHGGRIPYAHGKRAVLSGHHMTKIYEILETLGVIRVVMFETDHYDIRIAVVLEREIDPAKYDELPGLLLKRRLGEATAEPAEAAQSQAAKKSRGEEV